MTFTVEDGTGLADANALADVEFCDAYFSERGVATWTGTDTVKEQAIVRATDYVETRWGRSFLGARLVSTQALSFPRSYLYDRDGNVVEGVPTNLKKAVAEYAVRALSKTLMNDPSADEDYGAQVVSFSEKVGPITTSKTYSGVPASGLQPYPAADRLLADYLPAGGRVYR